MKIQLVAFEYVARGEKGASSERLEFGRPLTIVGGDNTSGKTPMMKGIMAALGHEVDLPPFVVTNCSVARLEVVIAGTRVVLSRELGEQFVLVTETDSAETVFRSQGDFFEWFTRILGAEPRKLTNRRREEAALYPSVFHPLFWVDQDRGWTTAYSVPFERNFILDQRQEVIRFAFGLPERHPFRSREEFDSARKKLERAEKALELQRLLLEKMRSSGEPLDFQEEEGSRHKREALREELRTSELVVESVRRIGARYDVEIEDLERRMGETSGYLQTIERQQAQLQLSLSQIESEVEVLTANVQATDLLRQFCETPGCSLFLQSAEPYGRALLFMKDQIKDLNSADRGIASVVENANERLRTIREELSAKRSARHAAIAASEIAGASARLEQVTHGLVAVELYLARLEQYRVEAARFENQLDRKEELVRRVMELRPRPGKRDSTAVADARVQLSRRMNEWLQALGTKNVEQPATFDEDFSPFVGGTEFTATSHESGSSRTRIVLAFHAAILEVALELGGNHPGLLILDAPKQHELEQKDFDAYVARIRDVARRNGGSVQVVLSMAHLSVEPHEKDVVWMPAFDTSEGLKYLRSNTPQ